MNRPVHASRIDRSAYGWRLYEKARRARTLDASALDLTRDRSDAAAMQECERSLLLRLFTMFYGGEEAVTADLLPMIAVVSGEQLVADELFLTTYLADEARHVELFDMLLFDALGAGDGDLPDLGGAYHELFGRLLPEAMQALETDRSVAAQVRAGVVYQLIVEGTLAETGYHGIRMALAANELMPATCQAFELLTIDESRHVAWGLARLDALLRRDPNAWSVLEEQIGLLTPLALEIVADVFEPFVHDDADIPFGLDPDTFTAYAVDQLGKRIAVLEDARAGRPSRFDDNS